MKDLMKPLKEPYPLIWTFLRDAAYVRHFFVVYGTWGLTGTMEAHRKFVDDVYG